MQQQLENLEETVTKLLDSYNLRLDFPELFVKNLGQAKVTEAPFEKIALPEETKEQQDEDEFHLEGGEEEELVGIKSMQFFSSMIAPAESQKLKPRTTELNLNVAQCLHQSFGRNSDQKYNMVVLSENSLCYGNGCALIVEHKDTFFMFEGHHYAITTISKISSDPDGAVVASGTSGIRPEIFIWKYQFNNPTNLELIKQIRLKKHSPSVGMIQSLDPSTIAVSDAISLHSDSHICLYNIEDGSLKNKITIEKGKNILDYAFVTTKDILIVTDNQLLRSSHPYTAIKSQYKGPMFASICALKDHYVVGDKSGMIYYVQDSFQTAKQSSKSSHKMHKGWVFLLISFKLNDEFFIASCGSDDKCIKISQIDIMGFEVISQFNMNTYCTSLSYFVSELKPSAFLAVGCREGSTYTLKLANDSKDELGVKKLQLISSRLYYASSIRQKNRDKLSFNFSADKRLSFSSLAQTIVQLDLNEPNKQTQIKYFGYKSKPICMDIRDQQLLIVQAGKGEKYQLIVKNLKNIQKIQFQTDLLIPKKYGVPTKISSTTNCFVIGTDSGYPILFQLKSNTLSGPSLPNEKHQSPIESIIFQKNPSEGSIFFKTVSGGELFVWEGDMAPKGQTKRLKQLKSSKEIQWDGLCKYSWELKRIWDRIEYYADIYDATLVNQTWLCVAMYDGKLRIYSHPAAADNYKEIKLFPGQFEISSNSSLLACQFNCQVLVFNLPD